MSGKAIPDATQLLQSLLAGLRIERGGSYGSGGGTIYELSPGQIESHIDHRVASGLSRCLADAGYVITSQVELDELRAYKAAFEECADAATVEHAVYMGQVLQGRRARLIPEGGEK